MQDTPEQSTETVNYSAENTTQTEVANHPSPFSNGTFVIALIIIGLFILLVTWSISFTALFFGAFGTFLSVATCFLDHQNFRFRSNGNCKLSDENWAYLATRAVFGALFGSATVLLVIGNHGHAHWSAIAGLSTVGAFLIDFIVFKRATH
ncbi:hypothetical protein V757_09190 [Pelistega indica]|uniref:Uncharacterized protein n=1 Tax=Pelistega indica TaxID=1414851 RepID=V8FZP8_9BURK|nr:MULTISPECIES: hypothetical protein [Pelistega]ETD69168.1 hypothetical protein V757_09190 [Pelistega indica]